MSYFGGNALNHTTLGGSPLGWYPVDWVKTLVSKGSTASFTLVVNKVNPPGAVEDPLAIATFGGVISGGCTFWSEEGDPVHTVSPGEGYTGSSTLTYVRFVAYFTDWDDGMASDQHYDTLVEEHTVWTKEDNPTVENSWTGYPASATVDFSVYGVDLRSKYTVTPSRSDAADVNPDEDDLEEKWYVGPETTVEVVVGGQVSQSASFGIDVNDAADLTDLDWRLTFDAFTTHLSGVADTTYVSYDSVTIGDVPIDTSKLDQDSGETWTAGAGWTSNDGGKWEAVGNGTDIDINGAITTGAGNDWQGWIDQPFSVDLSELYVRRFSDALDYPDAEVKCYGITDPDGNELVLSASALRAAGTYVQQDNYSWIGSAPYAPWTGWTVGPNHIFEIDQDWAETNHEHRTDGIYNDLRIGIDGWKRTATSRTVDPDFSGAWVATHATSIDVNDPPATSVRTNQVRPSLWVGSGDLTVAGGDNDEWTVAASPVAPKATRELITVYFDRLNAITTPASPAYADGSLADAYLKEFANDDGNYPAPADANTNEDVTNWANFAYLRVGFDVPATATLTMTVTWREVTISDPHTSGSDRNTNFSYSTSQKSATYSVPFTSTGSQFVDVDLLAVPDARENVLLRHVDKIEFEGFVEGVWTLETLELREAASNSFRHLKNYMPWAYRYKGGLSGIVDGARTLWLEDSVGVQQERTLPFLNIVDGSGTGTDQTTPYRPEQVATILGWQQGYSATWSESVWDLHTQDPDLNSLEDGKPWDMLPKSRFAEGASWDWPLAPRVGSFTIARGLVYGFHMVKRLQAGGHGVAWLSGERVASATVYLFRRQVGDTTWVQFEDATADALGYWYEDGLRVLSVQGATPPTGDVKWEYGIAQTPTGQVTSIGSGFNREWLQNPIELEIQKHPDAAEGWTQDQFIAYRQQDNDVVVNRSFDSGQTWVGGAKVTTSGGHGHPAIAKFRNGDLLVATVQSAAASTVKFWRSTDDHASWTSLARTYTAQFPDLLLGMQGQAFLTTYENGTHIIRRGQNHFSTIRTWPSALTATTTSVKTSAALFASSMTAARAALIYRHTGEIYAAAETSQGGGIKFARSLDQGLSWTSTAPTVAGTMPDLTQGRFGTQYVSVLSGAKAKVFRGRNNFSTTLTWPSQLAAGGTSVRGSGIVETAANSDRPAILKLNAGGRLGFAMVAVGSVLQTYNSTDDGMTWSQVS